jgi:capsular exopolysaccharide synthesis family protein
MADHEKLPAVRSPAEPVLPGYPGEPGGGDAYVDPGHASEGDVGKALKAIRRRLWLVVGATAVGAAAAAFSYSSTLPMYGANTLIHVGDPQARQTGVTPIQAGPAQSPGDWQNLMRSFVVIEPVVQAQRLFLNVLSPEHRPIFEDVAVTGEIVPGQYVLTSGGAGERVTILRSTGEVVEEQALPGSVGSSLGIRVELARNQVPVGAEVAFTLTRPRDAAAGIASGLEIQGTVGSYMSVGMFGVDPYQTADLVNAVTESFIAAATDLARARSQELGQTLEQQLESAQFALEEAEQRLEGFQRANILRPASPGGVGTGMDEYVELEVQIGEFQRDREAIRRALEGSGGEPGIRLQTLEVVPSARASTELSRALDEVAEARADRRALLERYTADHPLVATVDRRLGTLESEVIPNLAGGVVQDLDVRIAELQTRRSSRGSELVAIPTRVITEAGLVRELARAEALYEDVSARLASARLAAISAVPEVRVVDWAVPSSTPERDRRALMALMILVAFTGAGGAGAILLDRADRRVRSPQEVEWQLGLQVLGVVPRVRRDRNGGVRAEDQQQAVESFRAIRTGILYAHGSAGPLVMTVSSPGAGDGKSFSVSNLALSFAELGRRTVVIDGDVRRGIQHRLLGVERKPGLTDLLSGGAALDDVIRSSSHPLLSVIPLGSLVTNAPELLSSVEMQELLADLKERFDVVLVDSCPLGAAADPVILGTLTGSLALVVRSGTTDGEHAEAMLRKLRRFPVRILGAIVNDVSGRDDSYYGYIPGYSVESSESLVSARTVDTSAA